MESTSDREDIPLFKTPINNQTAKVALSDSDSDIDLDNDNSYLASLNVSDRLKNILRYKDLTNADGDSDDDDDNDLFLRPSPSNNTPTITAATTTRLPPIEKQQVMTQQDRFQRLLAQALASDDNSSSSDDSIPNRKGKTKQKKKKKTAKQQRKPPKKKTSTTYDDSDTDSSSTPNRQKRSINNKKSELALLEDSSEDDSDVKGRKQLSRKAKMDMEQEMQRARREAHIKLKPRIKPKSIESLVTKVEKMQNDTIKSSDTIQSQQEHISLHSMKSSPQKASVYARYSKELNILQGKHEKYYATNNQDIQLSDDDDDDGLIICRPTNRKTKFLQSVLAALSPEAPSRMKNNNSSSKSPLALRTLNQQLLTKIAYDQQAHRERMVEKAKAMGIYMSPEERNHQQLEREKEAAEINLEVNQLLQRKKQQKKTTTVDPDTKHNDLILSGEEDSDEDENSDDNNDDDNDDDDDDDDGSVVFRNRRRMKTAKQRHHWDDDDEDDHKSNKIITKPVPEPVNSIAKFFSHRTDTSIQAENDETNDGPRTLTRLMQRTLIEDDEKEEEENHEETDEEDDEEEEEDHEETEDIDASATEDSTPKQTIHRKKERNDYVEEEAEEEEDEYYGLGGPDIAETEDLDQYEDDDMLVADNYEKVDNLELQAEYHKKMLESDQHEVERLIKDVTSGGLRRKRGAAAAGLLLDDYDLHDDYDQDDLVALRLLANRRKKTMMKGGDPMQHLASDPKTVAFAKAALPAPGTLDLSDDDEEEEEEEEEQQQEDHVAANNMKETTDDDDILPSPSIHLVIGDTTQVWTSDKKTIS